MYFRYIIEKFLDSVETTTGYDFLTFADNNKYYFYDPGLAFDPRLHKKLAQVKYEDRDHPWITVMFSRSQMMPTSTQSRSFLVKSRDLVHNTAELFKVKASKCNVSIGFVSNDPDYLESFEEMMLIHFDRTKVMTAPYLIPSGSSHIHEDFKYFVNEIEPSALDKWDTDSRGTLMCLTWGMNFEFPVLYDQGSHKLITQIITKIKLVTYIDDTDVIGVTDECETLIIP